VALALTAALLSTGVVTSGMTQATSPSLSFVTRTTADGLGHNIVSGVYAVGSTVYAATDGGLSISTNGGESFTNRTTTSGLGSHFIRAVYALDDTVYAATASGLSISTNGGATFTNRTSADGLRADDARAVYALDDTVYAATASGLSISRNGGATFTTATGGIVGTAYIRSVYATGSMVYAAHTPGWPAEGGLSRSTDSGTTFTTDDSVTNGLPHGTVNGVFAVGPNVYAATAGASGGLYVSTNYGATFTRRSTTDGLGSKDVNGVHAVGSDIYAATAGGLSVSHDGGATFTNYTTAHALASNYVFGVYVDGSTVYAATDMGLSISGSSSSGSTPPPLPIFAPSEPLDVQAASGNASATVTWSAPAAAGSFAISHYRATASPGGAQCLVAASATSCTLTGLVNGTAYTVAVQALSGAGWSPTSQPSPPVTPAAPVTSTLVITGSRSGSTISIAGTATGFGMGAILKPWVMFSGQQSATRGAADILIGAGGSFAWQRKTPRSVAVHVTSADGVIQSNSVVIRAR